MARGHRTRENQRLQAGDRQRQSGPEDTEKPACHRALRHAGHRVHAFFRLRAFLRHEAADGLRRRVALASLHQRGDVGRGDLRGVKLGDDPFRLRAVGENAKNGGEHVRGILESSPRRQTAAGKSAEGSCMKAEISALGKHKEETRLLACSAVGTLPSHARGGPASAARENPRGMRLAGKRATSCPVAPSVIVSQGFLHAHRPSLRLPPTLEESRLHHCRGAGAGARHRGQHRDFLGGQRGAAQAAPVSRSRAPCRRRLDPHA